MPDRPTSTAGEQPAAPLGRPPRRARPCSCCTAGPARTRGPARGSRSAGPSWRRPDQGPRRRRRAADRGPAPRASGRGAGGVARRGRGGAAVTWPATSCATTGSGSPSSTSGLAPAADDLASIVSDDPAAAAAVAVVAGVRARLEQRVAAAARPRARRRRDGHVDADGSRRPRRSVVGPAVAVRHAAGSGARTSTRRHRPGRHRRRRRRRHRRPRRVPGALRGRRVAMRTFFTELGGRRRRRADDGARHRRRTRRGGAGAGRCRAGATRRGERRAGLPAAFAAAMVARFADAADGRPAQPGRRPGVPVRRHRRSARDFLVATTRALVDAELAAAGDEPRATEPLLWPGHGPDPRVDPLPCARRRDDGRLDARSCSAASTRCTPCSRRSATTATPAARCSPTSGSPRTCSGNASLQLDGDAPPAPPRPRRPPPVRTWSPAPTPAARCTPGSSPRRSSTTSAARHADVLLGVLRQRRRQPVGRHDPRPAPARRAATAVLGTRSGCDEPRGDLVESQRRDPRRRHHARGACSTSDALDVVTDLAVDTHRGRGDRCGPRSTSTSRPRPPSASGASPPASAAGRDPNSFLREAMRTPPAWRPTSSPTPVTGPRPRACGDDVIGPWIDLGSLSIGARQPQFQRARRLGRAAPAPVIGELLGPAADVATSTASPTTRPARRRSAEANAEAATDQLLYVWYREAYRQGVIVARPPGRRRWSAASSSAWEDVRSSSPPSVRQRRRCNRLEETTGPGGVNLDGNGAPRRDQGRAAARSTRSWTECQAGVRTRRPAPGPRSRPGRAATPAGAAGDAAQRLGRQAGQAHRPAGVPAHLQPDQLLAHVLRRPVRRLVAEAEVGAVHLDLAPAQERQLGDRDLAARRLAAAPVPARPGAAHAARGARSSAGRRRPARRPGGRHRPRSRRRGRRRRPA